MPIRGIRGAIQAKENSAHEIHQATRELLEAICSANQDLHIDEVASIFFTLTPDLDAAYPALAARQMGWIATPLLCAQEIPVPNSLPRVVRVLLHWNTDIPQPDVRHVYLGAAGQLRPDLNVYPGFRAIENGNN